MKILYSFASKSRPNQFFSVIENIKNLSASSNYHIVAKLDIDDVKMRRSHVLQNLEILEKEKVTVKWGTSKNKIEAINRGLEDEDDFDILINMSDDQLFKVWGFDDIIRHSFEEGKHFLHFTESFAKERVAVMNITTKEYWERRGRLIYRPEYNSLFCDEEETICAKQLGVYKLCEEDIFDHYHYSAQGKYRVQKDQLYIINDTYRKDEIIFKERKARNFDLEHISPHAT